MFRDLANPFHSTIFEWCIGIQSSCHGTSNKWLFKFTKIFYFLFCLSNHLVHLFRLGIQVVCNGLLFERRGKKIPHWHYEVWRNARHFCAKCRAIGFFCETIRKHNISYIRSRVCILCSKYKKISNSIAIKSR